jgi:hypothetical protein
MRDGCRHGVASERHLAGTAGTCAAIHRGVYALGHRIAAQKNGTSIE